MVTKNKVYNKLMNESDKLRRKIVKENSKRKGIVEQKISEEVKEAELSKTLETENIISKETPREVVK